MQLFKTTVRQSDAVTPAINDAGFDRLPTFPRRHGKSPPK